MKSKLCKIYIICLVILLCYSQALAEPYTLTPEEWQTNSTHYPQEPQVKWQNLETGLSLANIIIPQKYDILRQTEIIILRIDPNNFEFVLKNASLHGQALSFEQWAAQDSLIAAINASMYLPDAKTSTGYMRNYDHINNPRIVNKFGAFFVASPKNIQLKNATILDRTVNNWQELIENYNIVIQNYRLISAEKKVLWAPNGPSYAISAVGEDNQGNILFIHCREPIAGEVFGQILISLPLNISTVMYVEGGPQAGLLINAGQNKIIKNVWMGRHLVDFLTTGNKEAPLPNIIGVKRKQQRLP